uniref:Uncharacterized protein n=1 Tax=Trichogramma kaykai TaxID=54128 RepID=A0ABD2WWW1_9HYME
MNTVLRCVTKCEDNYNDTLCTKSQICSESKVDHLKIQDTASQYKKNKASTRWLQKKVEIYVEEIGLGYCFETIIKGYSYLRITMIVHRKFFRQLALDSLLELTRYRLPILCYEMIIDESFTNKDLYNVYLVAADQSS